jgi:hypothetical protein
MPKKLKVQLLSISYKVGRKTFTVTPKTKKVEKPSLTRGESSKSMLPKVGAMESNEEFMCINGVLHIKICVGTSCNWFSTGEPCEEE